MSKPWVSDHAIVRFLERRGRINRIAIEREILAPRVVAAVTDGVSEYYDAWNNVTYIIDPDRHAVVTIWNGRRGEYKMNLPLATEGWTPIGSVGLKVLAPILPPRTTDRSFLTEHDFAYLELRAARAYLERCVQIAIVKQEHGLLTDEEAEDLELAVAELMADIQLWKTYR